MDQFSALFSFGNFRCVSCVWKIRAIHWQVQLESCASEQNIETPKPTHRRAAGSIISVVTHWKRGDQRSNIPMI